jgi:hypothetical protein
MFFFFSFFFLLQAKYDQAQAARKEKILPYVHSDSNLQHLGVHHLPHSKSDANFLRNGNHSFLQGGGDGGSGVDYTSSSLMVPQVSGVEVGEFIARE